MVWAKGYRELLDLLAKHKSDLDGFNVDVFGNGEDAHEVQTTARTLNLNVNFMKGRDHADDSLHSHLPKDVLPSRTSWFTFPDRKILACSYKEQEKQGKGMGKSVSMPNLGGMVDGSLAFAHYCLTGNEFLRLCTGAIPGTRDYDKQHCEDLHLLPPR
ncbi:Digalactosyldiacylglycerol synthase 1, chloroplastic [Datura stramonium]|uniref:Digalactosyldiacylglycerol synthase 1, chloroplastic n=1 Tax=Datura stramonium TaxID=4076 RepID=A0ABS8VMV7_DATST|nr:Digalactosyldiacylglycerol synthase 1, chloroplastic [Datura stramonium]